jgi:hypothetical protein
VIFHLKPYYLRALSYIGILIAWVNLCPSEASALDRLVIYAGNPRSDGLGDIAAPVWVAQQFNKLFPDIQVSLLVDQEAHHLDSSMRITKSEGKPTMIMSQIMIIFLPTYNARKPIQNIDGIEVISVGNSLRPVDISAPFR